MRYGGLSKRAYKQATCRILGIRQFSKSHYSTLRWPSLPERFLCMLASTSLAQNQLELPPIALAQDYLKHRVRISRNKYEEIKSYTHRMRIANYNTMSASNRQNDTPRTRNGRDKILDPRYNAKTQQHLIYSHKWMFAIGRKCTCGERFTLSLAERCFGIHMKIEGIITEDEFNVTD